MTVKTAFEIWIAVPAGLMILGAVLAILQLRYMRDVAMWPLLWALMYLVAFGGFVHAGNLWDAPGAYTQQVDKPQAVRIEHLDYLPGDFWNPRAVRVDTSQGVHFMNALIPIPNSGVVFAVKRQKFWGEATRWFLCPNQSLENCWPTLANK